jgi:hypothetical protein
MRSRLWRIGLIVATLAVGIALGGVLGGGLSRSTPSATQAVGPDVGDIRVGANDAGPHDKVDGVGVGFTHSEDGAVAAATNLILTLEQAGNTDRGNAIRAYEILAADGSREFLAAEMGKAWDALHGTIKANGPVATSLFMRTVPVGHQVARYSDDRATIEIWTLTVIAADGMSEPLATWETAVVEVVWEADDWKVWSATSNEGPSPAWALSDVTSVEPFLSAVESLEGYRYVAS